MQVWDIFCAVVDNYGDIGVCARLARMLADARGKRVRLWVDDPASLARIGGVASRHPVEVRHWTPSAIAAIDADTVADVVIEAFGCALPAVYLEAMAARAALGRAPVWIDLEYLSAEDWVGGCHRLASPHPDLPLTRHFFFPGFDTTTGGLLREPALDTRRAAFLAAGAPWWGDYGLGSAPTRADAMRISLFCYDNANLPALAGAWRGGARPVDLLVPEGVAPDLASGGALRVVRLPFVAQSAYDALLWASDLNFVRGEDSFVRAQWAARPLIWHIYPQSDGAHLVKLDAFLGRYDNPAAALTRLWNTPGAPPQALATAWQGLLAAWPDSVARAEAWAQRLHRLPELSASLCAFAENLIRDD